MGMGDGHNRYYKHFDPEEFLKTIEGRRPEISGESKTSYTIEDFERGEKPPEAGRIGEYVILNPTQGRIVGGVGTIDHPPNAHPTIDWVLEEAYIGTISSIEETTQKTGEENKSQTKVTLEGLNGDYGLHLKKGEDWDEEYKVKVVKMEPFEETYDQEEVERQLEKSNYSSLTLPSKLGAFFKTPPRTLHQIASLPLSDFHKKKRLAIEEVPATKCILPDGTEIILE